jgi:hypothetical protein
LPMLIAGCTLDPVNRSTREFPVMLWQNEQTQGFAPCVRFAMAISGRPSGLYGSEDHNVNLDRWRT